MSVRPGGFDWRAVGPRLTLALAVIVIASVVAVGYLAVRAFDRAVQPELANRTRLVGSIVREAIQRPLELGVPFEALAGLDSYLAETLARFDEVDRITIASTSGTILAGVERESPRRLLDRAGLSGVVWARGPSFSLPILDGSRLVGTINVDVRPDLGLTRLRDVFLDVTVIALVAMLIALELSLGIAAAAVGKPLKRVLQLLAEQRAGTFLHRIRPSGLSGLGRTAARLNDHAEDLAQRLATLPSQARVSLPATLVARIAEGRPRRLRLSDINDIRPALFLLSVATEIAASFLPIYARSATRPGWLSAEIAAAAPLLLYLIAIAALMPFGGGLARRFGPRRLFVASMLPIAVALAAMGFAGSALEVALLRGAIGVFYATATVACQEYALRVADGGGAARALGGYLAVIYGGVFAGSALGGVVAGRFGFEAAFLTATAIAGVATILARATMTGDAGLPGTEEPAVPRRPAAPRRRTARYLALLVGIAVPMNAATAIYVWYLTPLMLAAAGARIADIARVVMLYYLAAILLGPVVARLAERARGPVTLVLAGALVSGTALLSLSLWDGFWALACATAGLGIGHALIRAPQYVIAVGIAAGGGPSIGGLRLFERLGAIAGLAASTFLLRDVGAAQSIEVLGVAVLSGAGLFAAAEVLGRLRRA